MSILAINMWALWLGFGLMLVAALINLQTLRVPNWLSLPATLMGWTAALVVALSALPSQGGGLIPSLAASAVGFVLLLPFYVNGLLGAGCVKMQLAFGAWLGCALGLAPAVLLSASATVFGGVLTVITAQDAMNDPNAATTDRRAHLFPAQVTLSLGSICAVAVPVAAGWL